MTTQRWNLKAWTDHQWIWLVVLVVIVGNIGIYWQQVLWRDDYYFGVYRWRYELKSGPSLFTEGFFFFNRAMCWVAGHFSQHLARSVYLFGIMVPASVVLFSILRKLKYSLPVAFFTSCMMWVFPGQTEIPHYVNGGYIAEALLFMLGGFWCGLEYLRREDKLKWGWFAASLILFYCGQRMSELVVPTSFLLALCYLAWDRFGKKAWMLVGPMAVVSAFQLYRIIAHGRRLVRDAEPLSLEGLKDVVGSFAIYCIPRTEVQILDANRAWILVLVVGAALAVALVQWFKGVSWHGSSARRCLEHYANTSDVFLRALVPLAIMLVSLVVMAKSPWFSPRHAVLPAIGFYLLLSYSFDALFHERQKVVVSVLLLFVSVSMLQHTERAIKQYAKYNEPHQSFVEFARTQNWPAGAQIVVVDMDVGSGGYLRWSTGYLSYVLHRTDITGVIGTEFMLSNPFSDVYNFGGGMTGLNLSEPIFLYRRTGGDFDQLLHFLQWYENSPDSSYAVYQVDPASGYTESLFEGKGLQEFVFACDVLEERGIKRSEVMWGGEPSSKDKQRLGI